MVFPLLIPIIQVVAGGVIGFAAAAGSALASFGLSLAISGGLAIAASFFSTSQGNSGFSGSPTYGWSPRGNLIGPGSPIWVVYGEHEITPPRISSNVVVKDGTILFRGLFICSQGRCDTATMAKEVSKRFRINKVPISQIKNCRVEFLPGTAAQTVPAGFEEVGRPFQKGVKLQGGVTASHIVEKSANGVRLLFSWPNGIIKFSSKGKVLTAAGGFDMEYRPTTQAAEWKPVKAVDSSTPSSTATSIRGGIVPYVEMHENPDWHLTAPEDGGHTSKKEGRFWSKGATRSPIRRVLAIRFPLKGTFEFRLTGLTGHDDDNNDTRAPTLDGVVEYETTTENYANLSGFALEIPASEQLNGPEPEVEVLWRGRELWDPRIAGSTPENGPFVWSRNPALAILDVYLNRQYGRGSRYSQSRILIDSFKESANLADAQISVGVSGGAKESLWELDLVVDTRADARQWIYTIAQTCRATVFSSEGLVKIVHDVAQATVRRHFEADPAKYSTRHNVLALPDGSADIKRAWIQRLPNSVTFKFRNRDRNWENDTVRLATSDDVGQSIPEDPLEMQVFGIARASQAYREALYTLQKMNGTPLLPTIGVSYGDLDLEPFDLVTVSFDDFGWSSKQFLVIAPAYAPGNGRGALLLQEYSAGIYPDGIVYSRSTGAASWATQYVQPPKAAVAAEPAPKSTPPPPSSPPSSRPASVTPSVVILVSRGAIGGPLSLQATVPE